ncbi:Aminotransferase class I and II [seawater metagenome]|uniref:Aminotransferase class I and II n=1 Tax=seawater metagenome TaxID=1561972 RepID=A0A5E8CKL3_9ZZZZ
MVRYGQYTVPSYNEQVNFGVGQPSTEMLPLELIQQAMAENLDIKDPSLLQYGDIPGYYEFREALSTFLKREYMQEVKPDDLFVSNGISQTLGLLCSLFTKTGDIVIVEEPTYFLAINIFREFNLNIKSISIEDDGVSLTELEAILEENKDNERILFYTIPSFHNPTSITMSHHKRVKLGNLADKYSNMLVFADEVYQLLFFEENNRPPPPLKYYHENFISLGSFSKILAPSLRLGWIHASNKILDKIINSGQLDSSGGLNPFVSSVVHRMIDNGTFEKQLNKNREVLKIRSSVLYERIQKNLGDKGIKILKPDGGYFLWLEFKKNLNVANLLKLSSKHKVKFHSGNKFSSKNGLKNCLRISFSYYSKEGMEIGADRLSNLINEYNDNKNNKNIYPKIAINGADGKLGSLIRESLNENKLNYVGPIMRGSEIDDNIDLIIDVSSESGNKELMEKIKDKKIPLIIGTTGNLPIDDIKKYSRFAPVAIISNFSEGIPYIIDCLRGSQTKLNNWNASILEKHHINKKDKPSGTAKTLAEEINGPIEIESIREGDIFGEHIINFKSKYENITIKHEATSRKIFAEGVIKYINWIQTRKSGLYYEIKEDIVSNNVEFIKYSGCGNDFIIIDKEKNKMPSDIPEFIKKVCPRGSSVGADGVIFIETPYDKYNIKWTYFNSDGSIAKMCGNGARCVAKYFFDRTNTDGKINMITADGIITDAVLVNDSSIITSIGIPTFRDVEENLRLLIENILDEELMKSKTMDNIYRVDILVNHLVIIVKNESVLDNLYVNRLGKIINDLLDVKVNVNFVTINNDNFKIRTYERGVFSETLACGTGCCALGFVIHNFLNKNEFSIKVKSGDNVKILFDKKIVYLEGEANKIYKGTIDLNNYQNV